MAVDHPEFAVFFAWVVDIGAENFDTVDGV
jgi:hypothetical protein